MPINMSSTKKIIIFILVIGVLGIGALWFFSREANLGGTYGEDAEFNIKRFLPFGETDQELGTNIVNQNQTNSTKSDQADEKLVIPITKLRKLSERPVAGATIFNISTTSVVRWTDKDTGNIYEARSDNKEVERLSNETIAKIARAFWLPDGSGFLAQRLDDNETI